MTTPPIVGSDLITDPRPPRRIQAARTRAASGPTARLLSPPSMVTPDLLVGATGRLLPRRAYDLGLQPPDLPIGAVGLRMQDLGLDATIEAVLDVVLGVFPSRKATWTGVRRVLGWLDRFGGDTWEQRWLASGADLAPKAWRSEVLPRTPLSSVAQGVNALMVARVLRPSYGWQLATRAGGYLPQRMLGVNDPVQLEQPRALPAYRSALLRHQYAAPACAPTAGQAPSGPVTWGMLITWFEVISSLRGQSQPSPCSVGCLDRASRRWPRAWKPRDEGCA
ncbi:hypothetical protein ACIA49_32985 [Kribbella sp. NPDC051587]|uniref:hypothetical protein n=1 Tax=Kribbella sp. NPDC051587 TaxID=3364119 RepID=UPI0037B93E5F